MVTLPASFKFLVGRGLLFVFVGIILIGSGVATALSLPHPTVAPSSANLRYPADISASFINLTKQVANFQDRQVKLGRVIVSAEDIRTELANIQMDAATRQYNETRHRIAAFKAKLAAWDIQLTAATVVPVESATAPIGLTVPILLYHNTPGNFRDQLEYLKTHAYTVVDLDQIAAAMSGGTALPAKPVAITFDDGFSTQLQAVALLKQYNFKATFYIISSGSGSQWCIGAGRRYHDPLQPAAGCGDSYLSWDQVRAIDRDGRFTIGAHTVDHQNLATVSPAQQRLEIDQNKIQLEAQLGHGVRHFCYPYGSYNQATIELVRQAGFITATTTLPGTIQPPGSLLALRRIRDTLSLP